MLKIHKFVNFMPTQVHGLAILKTFQNILGKFLENSSKIHQIKITNLTFGIQFHLE